MCVGGWGAGGGWKRGLCFCEREAVWEIGARGAEVGVWGEEAGGWWWCG